MSDVIVIGAGAAGIMAALRAAELGASVTLLEKTSRIGTKILISGGGKCNIAHDGSLESVIKAFRPNEARFIRPACYRLPNSRIIELFTERGLRVMTREDGRVFPVDQTAKDVVEILRQRLEEAGVRIRLNTPVAEIESESGRIKGVRLGAPYEPHKGYRQQPEAPGYGAKALLRGVMAVSHGDEATHQAGEFIATQSLVLATGGSSYPNSGTTGDGWPWAKQLGHKIERVHAALAPLYIALDSETPAERAGVALRDVILKARQNGKELTRWRGDLLFTHQGISGPTALGISRIVAENLGEAEVTLEVDLRPDESPEAVGEKLLRGTSESPKRLVASLLEGWIPQSLTEPLLAYAGIEPAQINARLDKKSRNRLAAGIKGWPLGTVRAVPLEKGEVCAGGVSLDEVDPQTMRSKLVKGLYLCGEVLDIAGPVGGYNLQSAFATGFVAGETSAHDLGFGVSSGSR